jgi:hypothetical protein
VRRIASIPAPISLNPRTWLQAQRLHTLHAEPKLRNAGGDRRSEGAGEGEVMRILNAVKWLGIWGIWAALMSCSSEPTRVGERWDTKDSYSVRASESLDQMQSEIDKLRSRASGLSASRASETSKVITDLEGSMTTARTQLDELKAADNESWESFRPRVEATMSEMRQTLDQNNVAE